MPHAFRILCGPGAWGKTSSNSKASFNPKTSSHLRIWNFVPYVIALDETRWDDTRG